MEIKDWIKDHIIVTGFPNSKEIRSDGIYSDCNVFINVSDEFYLGNSEEIMKEGKLNYWFPMGESGSSMGLNSIYGALNVIYEVHKWNPEWKILVHCQAGRNRSPLIKSAFHYMMTNEHLPIKAIDNRLITNCNNNHLPSLEKIEKFLIKSKKAFDHPEKFFGGMFDWIMNESGIDKIK